MSPFGVTVLGVGDAFSARHVNASLLLEADGFRLGIDCPDRYAGVLARADRLTRGARRDLAGATRRRHGHALGRHRPSGP